MARRRHLQARCKSRISHREGRAMLDTTPRMPACPCAPIGRLSGLEHGHSVGPSDQRHRRGPAARRLLRGRDGRRLDLLRHARCRQHRAPGLHHSGLLHRLHRQRTFGADPIVAAIVMLPAFYLLGTAIYQVYYCRLREARPGGVARPRLLLRPSVHHRGRADLGVRRRLPLRRGALHRADMAHRFRRFARCACWFRAWSRC